MSHRRDASPTSLEELVQQMLSQQFEQDPKKRIISLSGNKIAATRQLSHGVDTTSALEALNRGIVTLTLPHRPSRTCYLLVEPSAHFGGDVKVHGVIRAPGVLDAIVNAGVSNIQRALSNQDVDQPEQLIAIHIINVYRRWYPASIAKTYEDYIANRIIEALSSPEDDAPRIQATLAETGHFLCRRI